MLRRNTPSGMDTNTAQATATLIQPMICTTLGRRIASPLNCMPGWGAWYHKEYHRGVGGLCRNGEETPAAIGFPSVSQGSGDQVLQTVA
jgi:hypothetical protein